MQYADHTAFQKNNQSEQDRSLLVKFFIKARPDKQASKREGRPIYRDTEYVDIKIPGNRGAGSARPATEADKQRFPDHYARFKQRIDEDFVEGTPLGEWPLISRSLVEELSHYHVKTVEQLAGMADVQVAKWMGLFPIRDKAKVWLQQASGDKKFSDLQGEINELRGYNEELKLELKRLIGAINAKEKALGDDEKDQITEFATSMAADAVRSGRAKKKSGRPPNTVK